jgi:hypothetical protein
MYENLTEDNFLLYAASAYEKPGAITSEFEADLSRLLYVKRLLTKYYATGVLKDRLIMNHLVILYNVFGDAATRLLFFKLDDRDREVIKPFLIYINRLSDMVRGINGTDIDTRIIRLDMKVVEALRTLK